MAGEWRRIELSREQIRAGELERIRAQFSVFCMTSETAGDVAVFTRRGQSGASEVYFSPASLPYAEFVFDRHPPCVSRPPALLGSTLLVGSHAAVANLLGKSADVQSLRKTAGESSAVDVTFLQPDAANGSGK